MNQTELDAKRFRCLMLIADDPSAGERVESSGLLDAFDGPPSSAVAILAVDTMIALLEQAEYTI